MEEIKTLVEKTEQFVKETYNNYLNWEPNDDWDEEDEFWEIKTISERPYICCSCESNNDDLTLNVVIDSFRCDVRCGELGEEGNCNISNPDTIEEVMERIEKSSPSQNNFKNFQNIFTCPCELIFRG